MALWLLLTASRTWDHPAYIWDTLDGLLGEHGSLALFHGACPEGGDAIADLWARRRRAGGLLVELHRFPVNHTVDGPWPAAGPRRNARMLARFVAVVPAGEPTACHGFVRDGSSGTTGCMKLARRAGIPVEEHAYEAVVSGG